MKCERIHPLFSDLMDQELSGDLAAAARQHRDLCESCRVELDSFIRSTQALRSLTVPQTSGEYVRKIMVAVDGAGPAGDRQTERRQPARIRRVGAHLVSALIGAAIALLLFRLLGTEPTPLLPLSPPAQIVQTRLVEVPAAVRLVHGRGSLVRSGRTESIDAQATLLFEPGDIYRLTDGADLTLSLGDSGVVRIEAAPALRPEPTEPKVVERVIEKTRIVRRGPLFALELDNEAVARAADRVSSSIDSMRNSLRLVGRNSREQVLAPPEAAPLTRPVASREPTPMAPPVVIHRVAGRLILETSGQPYEVLPALIGFLDDPDPDLVDMVLDRLETIRLELNADPTLFGSLELESPEQADQGAMEQFTSFFSKAQVPAESQSLNDSQRWNMWWERNAVRILQAETYGTF